MMVVLASSMARQMRINCSFLIVLGLFIGLTHPKIVFFLNIALSAMRALELSYLLSKCTQCFASCRELTFEL